MSKTHQKTQSSRVAARSSGSTRVRVVGSVWASNAAGMRITGIRYTLAGIKLTRRLHMVVTLRDGKQRFVRGAIVSVGRFLGAKTTISGFHATFTNRLGQATFALPVTKGMFGSLLLLNIKAQAPRSHALAIGSVRLPRGSRAKSA
jgi:hypothetical protein